MVLPAPTTQGDPGLKSDEPGLAFWICHFTSHKTLGKWLNGSARPFPQLYNGHGPPRATHEDQQERARKGFLLEPGTWQCSLRSVTGSFYLHPPPPPPTPAHTCTDSALSGWFPPPSPPSPQARGRAGGNGKQHIRPLYLTLQILSSVNLNPFP